MIGSNAKGGGCHILLPEPHGRGEVRGWCFRVLDRRLDRRLSPPSDKLVAFCLTMAVTGTIMKQNSDEVDFQVVTTPIVEPSVRTILVHSPARTRVSIHIKLPYLSFLCFAS
jgi:hypothetical protein